MGKKTEFSFTDKETREKYMPKTKRHMRKTDRPKRDADKHESSVSKKRESDRGAGVLSGGAKKTAERVASRRDKSAAALKEAKKHNK